MSINDPMTLSNSHLPDCFRYPSQFSHEVKVCICDRLRAAEQRGFHRGYKTAVDYWRTVSTRYGKRKYREGRGDAARDVETIQLHMW